MLRRRRAANPLAAWPPRLPTDNLKDETVSPAGDVTRRRDFLSHTTMKIPPAWLFPLRDSTHGHLLRCELELTLRFTHSISRDLFVCQATCSAGPEMPLKKYSEKGDGPWIARVRASRPLLLRLLSLAMPDTEVLHDGAWVPVLELDGFIATELGAFQHWYMAQNN